MIRLNLQSEPAWIDLIPGLRVKVTPITTGVMAAARIAVQDAGVDLTGPAELVGIEMTKALARTVIEEWDGVGDADGNPIDISPEGIDALLDVWQVFDAFQNAVTAPHLLLEQEKNG